MNPEGLNEFSADIEALGDAYEYLIGQFAAGAGKKAGEFYTPQQISNVLSAIVTLDSQEPKTGSKKRLESALDTACGMKRVDDSPRGGLAVGAAV
ncbi:MAG: N-6 DNA methylase [Verrucomicrobiaceae bacterium]|nr:N-6 DNA methylase [Verrucomicrobiaceae bacterium]